MRNQHAEWWRRAQLILLCALVIVLPILEAPKNILAFLLVVAWVGERIDTRKLVLRRPDWVETSVLLVLLASVASTAANWPFPNGLKGLKDTLMLTAVFWLVYRANFSNSEKMRVVEMAAVGVIIGLFWGAVEVLSGRDIQLQFNSAGISTQSALYLGVALSASLGIAWLGTARTAPASRMESLIWWGVTLIMAIGLFAMGSRGAIVAVLVTVFLIAAVAGQWRFWLAIVGVLSASLILALLLPERFNQYRFVDKTLEVVTTGRLTPADAERFDNWRIAGRHLAESQSMILGIGPRNYASIDFTRMTFDPPLTVKAVRVSHAHNLFLTKLVEEGVAGLVALMFFFGVVIVRLVRDWRGSRWRKWSWVAGVGALVVPVVGGLFNTPWYLEHALLAMIILALYLSPRSVRA